ncbi:DUF6571 family protein [Embleya scabrispora]|uniref:DUF6571 family protein n=1 Tax=Embleya scabrispora TaxID=159449 RepID=UPI0003771BE6|nr:DUF6571 family protein [Embleya scabrispora]MYS80216.1 hypothetical protein [Streptomyces sp. SID5474]
MVGFAQLRDLKTEALRDSAQEFYDFASWLDRKQQLIRADSRSLTVTGQWDGPAAQATLTRYRGLDDVFEGGKTEYRAICAILRDAADDIGAAKKKLTDAIADAQAHELAVHDDGSLSWGPLKPQGHQPDPEDIKAHTTRMQQLSEDFQGKFKSALVDATDADARAASALKGDIGASATAFNAKAIGGGELPDSVRAAALAKRIDTLSPAELEELRNLLHGNEKSSIFATNLMNTLGPNGLLELQAGVVNRGQKWTGHDADGTTMDDLRAIQDALGTNLATATQPKGEPHVTQTWVEGLKEAGRSRTFVLNDMPKHYLYGYQLLGNMLHQGDYDKQFLGDIGKDMVAFDRSKPDLHEAVPVIRERFPLMDDAQGREGRGYDALEGLMDALGRNPGAAETVLDPSGGNLHYLLKERDWGRDTGAGSPADAFGKAFEAATTGHPAGATSGGPHTEGGARIMAEAVHIIGQEGPGGHFEDYRDSFGDAMASYMPDIHNELRNERAGGSAGPDPLFPNSGEARATFLGGTPDHDLLRTMAVVAEDPKAFKAMSDAEHSYIAVGLERIAKGDPPAGLTADQHLAQSAQVVGALDAVRTEAIRNQQVLSDKEYNDQVAWNGKIANAVVGGAVKMSPLPTMVAEPLSRIVALTTDYSAQQASVDTSAAADRTIADQHAWGRGYMQTIAADWAGQHGRESEIPGYDLTVDNNFTTGQRKAQEAMGHE